MKIQKLSLTHWDFTNAEKVERLEALKRNFSLLSVESSSLDEAEKARLQFFLDRNTCLAQWVENPLTVPHRLWLEAMKVAMEAGEATLFQSLLGLSGHAIGSLQGKRNRK